MSRIYVKFSGLEQIGSRCKSISSKVDKIQSDLQSTIRQLDWDVRYESNINSTANQIAKRLDQYSYALKSYQKFIEDAKSEYIKLDEYKQLKLTTHPVQGINIIYGPGDRLGPDWKNKINDIIKNTDGEDDILDAIKSWLKGYDKLGDIDEAGILENILAYLQNFKKFFGGDKKGLTGAGDLCSLLNSSADVWTGLYDYFADMYQGVKTGFWGDVAKKNVKVLGISSSFLGLMASILSASDGLNNKKWQSIVADYVDCGKDIISVINSGYALKHIGDIKSLADLKSGPWNALSLYSAIGEAGVQSIAQGFRSHEKYYADGKWDLGDTGATAIDISMAGIYGISHSLTFGLDDKIFGAINRAMGGNGNSDMSYFEQAAEGYKILAKKCGEAIGEWWLNLTT